jgi:hypothetical protein
MIIPVVTGTTGRATKVLKKNLAAIPGKLLNRFSTGDSCTWNSILNTKNTAV